MANSAVTVDKIPGGRYTAQDNGDGTWNILDVAIMGEMFEGEKGVPFDLGETWHKAALRKAEEREADGHWGSIHVNHHEKGLRTERAGFLRLRRVGSLKYEGREMSCVYADLLRVPKHLFDLIDRAEIPYMSVEIASWEEPEIASLAIMPDETPFFRLPMLTTGKKVKANEPVRLKNSPALAYANASDGGFILFKLGGAMPEAKKEEPKKLSLMERLKAFLAAKPDATDADLQKELAVEPKKEEPKAEAKKEEKTEVKEEPGTFGRAPVEQDKAAMAEMARLQAKVDGLEAKDAKREREDKVRAIVLKAHEDLKGYYLSADTKAKLQKYAEKDLSGESVNDFVSTYKSIATPDDAPAGDTRPAAPAVPADEPEALAKLAAKGPDAVARGREIYREFLQAREMNHVPASMTFERYLDINLSLPALKVRGK